MKQRIISVLTIGVLLLIILVMCIAIFGGSDEKGVQSTTAESTTTIPSTVITTVPTTVPDVITTAAPVVNVDVSDATTTAPVSTTQAVKQMPQTTKEIIDKYTQLVNDFKAERPAYKKKEFQALPEEYRKFGTGINLILNIASGYMVTEEECEELVRPAGCEDIVLYDMPIHNSDKGCLLTDYDAVFWAKCEDMGDGTYKISFSLKEEVDAQPTPADTLVPVSAHGAVMQPVALSEIMTEVDKITASVPGIALNHFNLYYRDCEFICIYDVETDRVLSITHHIVIDIAADLELFLSQINGTARLLNEMYIYDITW